jgi:hypothetical protein
MRLPDPDAVRDYLIARFVAPEVANAAAQRIATPLAVTKRGAVISARK